jgi:glycogen(starch) synthase
MHLLIVTNLYPPQELGGYGRSMADFAWGLKHLGHTLEVLCSDAPYLGPPASGPSGEVVHRSLQLKGSFEGGVQQLQEPKACSLINEHNNNVVTKLLNLQRFDGILLGNLDLLGHELIPALLKPGVLVLHHVGFIAAPFDASHWPDCTNYQVVAASHAVRQSLVDAGWPAVDCPVVYPGARVELFGHGQHNVWRALQAGKPNNPLKVCFAGLLMASKGAHTVVEAAGHLARAGIAVQVNLAGAEFQQGYWSRLKQLAMSCGIGDQLQWFGPLDRHRLARFLQLHQVGVFASIYPEAFGIVAAEIQASGLALISSAAGGAAEVFQHSISGLQFKPGDSSHLAEQLMRLVYEPKLLLTLQAGAMKNAHNFLDVRISCKMLENLWK